MESPIIELCGVRLTLTGGSGAVNVLRGVDLAVRPGETVSVMGPSGAGKTTLLMVLAGLERATEGTVRVAGVDLSPLDEDRLAAFRRRHVGIVFQGFHLVPTLTAQENVALPLEFGGEDEAMGKAEDALARVGLEARLAHYPGQLSGGEQQRVAIARAFVARPPLLLADEPTGNLDRETGEKVMELLFGLRDKAQTTLVLVTHDASLAERCERTVHMLDGEIQAVGEVVA